ncbi:MAG: S1C family serine protease [Fastidiosipilaceae bacterium]
MNQYHQSPAQGSYGQRPAGDSSQPSGYQMRSDNQYTRGQGFENPQPRGAKKNIGRIVGFIAILVVCTALSGVLGGYIGARQSLSYSVDPDMGGATAQIETASPTEEIATTTSRIEQTQQLNSGEMLSVADVVAQASPSVVAINTTSVVQNMYGQVGTVPGAGSGVIIRTDGYILTNNHVIGNATDISVTLASGETLPATLVGADSSNDLAVIKVDEEDLPAISTTSSTDLRAGDQVIAIGNPFGQLEGSVTSGIISSVNRNVEVEDSVLYNVIQIDAAINRGNSGGALLNMKGELIGINSAKAGGDSIEGIAFAIPTDTALPIAEQLISTGEVQAPEVGISGSTVSAEMQQAYQLPAGVLVEAVKPGSAADVAGIKRTDIISRFNGEDVNSVQDITALKNRLKAGDSVEVSFYRNGTEQVATLVLQSSDD